MLVEDFVLQWTTALLYQDRVQAHRIRAISRAVGRKEVGDAAHFSQDSSEDAAGVPTRRRAVHTVQLSWTTRERTSPSTGRTSIDSVTAAEIECRDAGGH